jgi:hypothetical protein
LRRTIIILIAVVLLIAAVAVAAHLVLRSATVGEAILSRVSEHIGMEVTAKSTEVSWSGRTVIRQLVVRMPVTGEAILSADSLEVGHAMLPLLVLGRPLAIRSVGVESPCLHLRRSESGRWNVQDAWDLLRAGASSGGRVALPRIAICNALVEISEPNEPPQTVGPTDFLAQPQEPFLWTFELQTASTGGFRGRLVQGKDWANDIDFAVSGLGPLLRQLSERDLGRVSVAGRWRGRVTDMTLTGRIQLDRAVIGPATLRGGIHVDASADGIALRPAALVLSEPNEMAAGIILTTGEIRIAHDAVAVQQLVVKAGPLDARIDGRWNLDAQAGRFSGSWAAVCGGRSECYGTCEGSLQSPQVGRVYLNAGLTAQARTVVGDWTMAATVEAAGPNWRRSNWQVSLPQFAWSRKDRRVSVTDASGEVDVNWPVIRLVSLHLPAAGRVQAAAQLDATTRLWSVDLQADNVHPGPPGANGLDVRFAATGDAQRVLVSEARVASGEQVVQARGELSLTEGGFQDVSVTADWPQQLTSPREPQAVQPVGRWHLTAGATGRIEPLQIEMDGQITGQNISIGRQVVPQMEVPIHASIAEGQVQVATQAFRLLSGQWQLTGQHDLSKGMTQLSLIVKDLSLEAAAGIAGSPLVSRGTAEAQVQLTMPRLQIDQAAATGPWSAHDSSVPPLKAQKARGSLSVAGGVVKFDDIQLEQADGRARAHIEFRLDRPQVLAVAFTTQAWPIRLGGCPVGLLVDSQADLQVDAVAKSARGQARLSGRVLLEDQDIARVSTTAFVEERALRVRDLRAEVLGGSVEGAAQIPLDRWTDSTGRLEWNGIQPQLLQQWWASFARFGGSASGILVVEQAADQSRAPGPMRFTLDTSVADGRYGPGQIEACRVAGYVSEDRLLIDRGELDALGGRANATGWLRARGDSYYASIIADFNGLNLDQIARVVNPAAHEYAGLTSGTVNLLYSSDHAALGGEADIKLTESDLAGNVVVGALHNILSLDIADRQPKGTGQMKIRFEGPRIVVQSFEYFNRGVETRGAGQIEDIYLASASPVDGYAVASTRVLKDVRLPGVPSLDRLMASFQRDAASVKIGGTLGDPQVKVVPLPVISSAFRRLLWRQLRQ